MRTEVELSRLLTVDRIMQGAWCRLYTLSYLENLNLESQTIKRSLYCVCYSGVILMAWNFRIHSLKKIQAKSRSYFAWGQKLIISNVTTVLKNDYLVIERLTMARSRLWSWSCGEGVLEWGVALCLRIAVTFSSVWKRDAREIISYKVLATIESSLVV